MPDAHEPNDLRANAALLKRGVPIEAYFFAGREYSTPIPAVEWLDWYSVPLERIASVSVLPNVPDVSARVVVYDPDGVQIASSVASADSTLDQQILTPGTYFIRVSPEIAWS